MRPPLPPPGTTARRDLDQMVDAIMAALDQPGGEEVLDRMVDRQVSVPGGLASLLILSGRYERR